MSEITLAGFDYETVSDSGVRASLRNQAVEIKAAIARTQNDILEIGRRLIDVKSELAHGVFQRWIADEFSMSESAALKFMQVADAFKNVNFTDLSFQKSALYVLAAPSVTEEVREEAIAMAESGHEVTHSIAKRLAAGERVQMPDNGTGVTAYMVAVPPKKKKPQPASTRSEPAEETQAESESETPDEIDWDALSERVRVLAAATEARDQAACQLALKSYLLEIGGIG